MIAFDPYSHVATQEEPAPVVETGAPRTWLHGIELLRDRQKPRLADAARWAQIIADCGQIIRHHTAATAAGWGAVELFGFDPVDPTPCLAVALRGRRLVDITPDFAAMSNGQSFAWHYRHLTGDVPMLWNFNDREYRL